MKGAFDVARTLTVAMIGTRDGHVDGSVVSREVKIPQVASSTRLTLGGSLKAGSRPTATVRVTASRVAASGWVDIHDGSKIVATGYAFRVRSGTATITLPSLARGTHRFTARFRGGTTTTGSTSAVTKVTSR